MSDLTSTLAYPAALLAGIVLIKTLFLYAEFYRIAEGYMWIAARRIWPYLLMYILVELSIGYFIFVLILPVPIPVPRPLLAGLTGIIVGAVPLVLEHYVLPKENITVKTLQRPLTRVFLKFNLSLRLHFAWAVESCKQQDLYDCQSDGWGLNLDQREIGRRLRRIYALMKPDIARERNDPTLLRYDVGHTPWDLFYLLVRHTGRKALREYIKNPPKSGAWDGSERRRRAGTKEDRNNPDPNPSNSRAYDDTR